MEKLIEYLPFLIPILIVELSLTVVALVHVLRHPHYRFGSKVFWIIMSFIQIIGPVIYFIFGKGQED